MTKKADGFDGLVRSDLPAGRIEWALARISTWSRRQDVQRAIMDRSGSGLTPGYAWTLARVVEHGPMRLSELAEILGIDASTLTPRVRHLVTAGLAECSPDPTDGRATRVAATEEGQQTFAALHTAYRSLIQDAVAHLATAERDALGRTLTLVADHLDATHYLPTPGDDP